MQENPFSDRNQYPESAAVTGWSPGQAKSPQPLLPGCEAVRQLLKPGPAGSLTQELRLLGCHNARHLLQPTGWRVLQGAAGEVTQQGRAPRKYISRVK